MLSALSSQPLTSSSEPTYPSQIRRESVPITQPLVSPSAPTTFPVDTLRPSLASPSQGGGGAVAKSPPTLLPTINSSQMPTPTGRAINREWIVPQHSRAGEERLNSSYSLTEASRSIGMDTPDRSVRQTALDEEDQGPSQAAQMSKALSPGETIADVESSMTHERPGSLGCEMGSVASSRRASQGATLCSDASAHTFEDERVQIEGNAYSASVDTQHSINESLPLSGKCHSTPGGGSEASGPRGSQGLPRIRSASLPAHCSGGSAFDASRPLPQMERAGHSDGQEATQSGALGTRENEYLACIRKTEASGLVASTAEEEALLKEADALLSRFFEEQSPRTAFGRPFEDESRKTSACSIQGEGRMAETCEATSFRTLASPRSDCSFEALLKAEALCPQAHPSKGIMRGAATSSERVRGGEACTEEKAMERQYGSSLAPTAPLKGLTSQVEASAEMPLTPAAWPHSSERGEGRLYTGGASSSAHSSVPRSEGGEMKLCTGGEPSSVHSSVNREGMVVCSYTSKMEALRAQTRALLSRASQGKLGRSDAKALLANVYELAALRSDAMEGGEGRGLEEMEEDRGLLAMEESGGLVVGTLAAMGGEGGSVSMEEGGVGAACSTEQPLQIRPRLAGCSEVSTRSSAVWGPLTYGGDGLASVLTQSSVGERPSPGVNALSSRELSSAGEVPSSGATSWSEGSVQSVGEREVVGGGEEASGVQLHVGPPQDGWEERLALTCLSGEGGGGELEAVAKGDGVSPSSVEEPPNPRSGSMASARLSERFDLVGGGEVEGGRVVPEGRGVLARERIAPTSEWMEKVENIVFALISGVGVQAGEGGAGREEQRTEDGGGDEMQRTEGVGGGENLMTEGGGCGAIMMAERGEVKMQMTLGGVGREIEMREAAMQMTEDGEGEMQMTESGGGGEIQMPFVESGEMQMTVGERGGEMLRIESKGDGEPRRTSGGDRRAEISEGERMEGGEEDEAASECQVDEAAMKGGEERQQARLESPQAHTFTGEVPSPLPVSSPPKSPPPFAPLSALASPV